MREKPTPKPKRPRCSYCGCVVRNTDFTGYENDALCRKCQKELEGNDKS